MNVLKKGIKNGFVFNGSIIFTALIGISVVLGTFISAFSIVALALSVAALFILSEEDSLCTLVFTMSFANIFKASPGSQSFFTYLILVYVLFYMLKKRKMDLKVLISLMILFAFLLLQFMISMDVLRSVKFFVNLLLIYFAVNLNFKNDYKKVFHFYIVGVIVSSLIAFFNVIPNLNEYVGLKDIGGKEFDDFVRFAGMYGDPNYYAVNVILSLCLIILLQHKKQINAIFALACAAVLVMFTILTYSKSAFLMLALPSVLLLYSKIKSRKYLLFAILAIACVIVLFNVLLGKIEFLQTILSRFEEADDANSFTGGRITFWQNYIEVITESFKNSMFGGGFGAELIEGNAPHNTFVDLWYYLGLTGVGLLILSFVSIAKTVKNPPRKNLLNYSAWICILIMYMFLSEIFYFDWAFHIIIAILALKTDLLVERKEVE